ncbi:MAG: SDR family oxidoreductase [Pseudomonadaceae bacterium]|nr:SDR family oxidoreductase [Pseudomonadaceae bacterium]
MHLDGKVAVVTGGADGIGLAAAKAFQKAGAQVVVADVSEEKLAEQVSGSGLHPVTCDVASDAQIERLAETANQLGDVDLVMANAGIAIGGRFELIPTTEWQRLFDINVLGVVRTINAFLPAMLERGRGHIVVTGSSAGLFRSNGMDAPYAASKYALRGMAQGLAIYARDSGVSVHYLAPRMTDTAFPRSSTAWGRKGSRITSDRQLGDDYDTVDDVIAALLAGIEADQFLISLTPDTSEKLGVLAADPLASL